MQKVAIEKSGFWRGLELFQWRSRVNRRKYISLYFFWWWLSLILTVIAIYSSRYWNAYPLSAHWFALGLFCLCLILLIAIKIHLTCWNIRRLHDFNARGWWVIFSFIPIVSYAFPALILFVRGTAGANRFGEIVLETKIRWWQSLEVLQWRSRVNQPKYLALFFLWNWLFWISCIFFGVGLGLTSGQGAADSSSHLTTLLASNMYLLLFVVAILMSINVICLYIRRLHDCNFRGWWQLLGFIPLLGWFFPIVIACIPGTAGANRFGEAPPSSSIFCKCIGFTLGILTLFIYLALPFIMLLQGELVKDQTSLQRELAYRSQTEEVIQHQTASDRELANRSQAEALIKDQTETGARER